MFFSGKVPKISEKRDQSFGDLICKMSWEPKGIPPQEKPPALRDFLKAIGFPFFRAWLFLGEGGWWHWVGGTLRFP